MRGCRVMVKSLFIKIIFLFAGVLYKEGLMTCADARATALFQIMIENNVLTVGKCFLIGCKASLIEV